jgi:hypothetical protein
MAAVEKIIGLYWEADRTDVKERCRALFRRDEGETAVPSQASPETGSGVPKMDAEGELLKWFAEVPISHLIRDRLLWRWDILDEFQRLIVLHYLDDLLDEGVTHRHSMEGLLRFVGIRIASHVCAYCLSDYAFPLGEPSTDLSYGQMRQVFETLGINFDDNSKLLPIEVWWNICDAVAEFRERYKLDFWRTWATIYDLGPRLLPEPPLLSQVPARVWIVATNDEVGEFDEIDAMDETEVGAWAINRNARRGDLALMYCTKPRSAVVSLHRVLEDAHYDPFGGWNGYRAEIGEKLSVPWLTLREMKDDPVLSEWRLTRGNFQGLLQMEVPRNVWDRMRELIVAKSPETAGRLSQYAESGSLVSEFKSEGETLAEKEIEDQLILPLLIELGWESGTTLKRQVAMTIKIGSGRPQRVIADFVGYAGALTSVPLLVVEAKRRIRSSADLDRAKEQAESYAGKLRCSRFCVAAPEGLWAYELRFPGQSYELTRVSLASPPDAQTTAKLQPLIGFDSLRRLSQKAAHS